MPNIDHGAALDHVLVYIRCGRPIFPGAANKRPLVSGGFKSATVDQIQVEAWWLRWPYAEPCHPVSPTEVILDIDVKGGRNGYADYERIFGCDPRTVETPSFTTPSGGMQLFFAASKLYRNAVAIDGTGLDTRALGGYTILPVGDGLNGRRWLRPLVGGGAVAPLPAPGWLDRVVARETPVSSGNGGLVTGELSLPPLTDDARVRRQALAMLARACDRIRNAPAGAQGDTRRKQVFLIGGVVARGDLSLEEAFSALLAASREMPVYRPSEPWRDLEMLTARSLVAGAARPLPLTVAEAFSRRLRAARQHLREGAHG
jgi:hypothetical protein